MTEEPAVTAKHLGRRFGRRWVLREASWQVPAGQVAAVVGPNGAGKTTLLRLATGLLAPSEGDITVLGQRPGTGGAPRGLSFLAQDKPLYRRLRVAEMLRAGAALNAGGRWDADRARRLVDAAGLCARTRVGALSAGQRTRLALALALGRRPRLLLLDEPLAELDPLARRQTLGVVLGEVAETGMTVLLSSHVLAELDEVCDHLVLVHDGTVRLCGAVDALLEQHRLIIRPDAEPPPGGLVHERRVGRQRTALVCGPAAERLGPAATAPTLEQLVLGYLEQPSAREGAR